MKLMEHFLPKPVKYIRITDEGEEEIVTIPKGPVELNEYDFKELEREIGGCIFPLYTMKEDNERNNSEQRLLWLARHYLAQNFS